MKNIYKVSYQYTRDFKNPINYTLHSFELTQGLRYKDALQIAYAVIDSLGGDYNYLEDLVDDFEKESEKGIKMEEI